MGYTQNMHVKYIVWEGQMKLFLHCSHQYLYSWGLVKPIGKNESCFTLDTKKNEVTYQNRLRIGFTWERWPYYTLIGRL